MCGEKIPRKPSKLVLADTIGVLYLLQTYQISSLVSCKLFEYECVCVVHIPRTPVIVGNLQGMADGLP
jgi:hypothetical protein